MTEHLRPKLLWLSLSPIYYLAVPAWVEEALRAGVPELQIVVARDTESVERNLEDSEIIVAASLQPEQLARCRKLRWIHATSAGVRQLMLPQLLQSDIVITNGRTVHAAPVAEQALALLMALARRLAESFEYQARHVWGHTELYRNPHLPTEVNEKTLGLVGLGSIGSEIARRARGLGMRVVAVRRDASRGSDLAERIYPPDQLTAFLQEVDCLVLTAPDTPDTHHMIGEKELRRMKSPAWLINISRGSLVDTDALARALESGTIAGAGLDVTEPEPLPPEHPLWRAPNLLITHHLGGATDRLWQRQLDLLKENLRRYLAGEPLLNLVDMKKGY